MWLEINSIISFLHGTFISPPSPLASLFARHTKELFRYGMKFEQDILYARITSIWHSGNSFMQENVYLFN